MELSDTPRLPIIDLSPFTEHGGRSKDPQARQDAASQLVDACKKFGFVYISGHGVSRHEIEHVFDLSEQFFNLPAEVKMKAPHPPGFAVHRGYSWPGLEKVSNALGDSEHATEFAKQLRQVQDYKESFEIGSEDNSEQPNIWLPDLVLPSFRPLMTTFYWRCFETAQCILRAFAVGLNVDEKLILAPHSGHHNQLRLLHYPEISANMIDEGTFARMPAHTDWTTITFLFQDDTGGLQVEHPDQPGTFIDVPAVPNTLVLNVGDLLMRWTNDELKSTQHRVQLPPLADRYIGKERVTRARYSIPYFVTTDPDVVIEPLPRQGSGQPKYEPISQREYSAMRARMQY